MNYNLFAWQIERMRSGTAPLSLVVDSAVTRYRRGEFPETLMETAFSGEKRGIRKEPVSIRKNYGLDSRTLRAVLTCHLRLKRVNFAREIAEQDRAIEEYWNAVKVGK